MKPYKLTDYKHLFFLSGEKRASMVRKIFDYCTYEEILYYIKNTPASLKGIFKYSLRYLKCTSYSQVYKQPIGCLKEPLDYIGLLAYIFPLFRVEINDFIKKREQYVRNYLLGNYDLCSQIIEEINLNDGYSAWAAINTIKIAGLQGGLDKSLEVLNILYEQGLEPLMKKTCESAQDTASVETSMDTFLEKKYLEDINKYSNKKWQKDFLTAHYYPFKNVESGTWMSYDLKSSIVDLYVNFIYNIGAIVNEYRTSAQLNKYLLTIMGAVEDDMLRKKTAFLNLCEFENSEQRKSLLDLFSLDKTIYDTKNIELYFKQYPYDIDLLFEYVIYLVRNHKKDIGLFHENSLFSTIGLLLYDYLKGRNKVTNLNKLKMICFSNPTLLCFRQLYIITENIEKGNLAVISDRYWFYSYGINYFDAVFYADKSIRKQFLQTHNFFLVDQINSCKLLNTNVLRQIIVLESFKDSEDVVNLLLDYYQEQLVPYYLKGAILSTVFAVLINLGKYKKAISLYVDNKLNYPNINIFIDVNKIERIFTRTLAASLNAPLDLSIFYSLINAKQPKLLSSVLRHLNQLGVKKPSEIIIHDGDLKNKYFLENVVDLNILTTIPLIFPEPSQPIEERVKIIDNLKNVYGDSDKKYSIERNSLVRKLGIMNMLKTVDASKIDVDENMLKRHELAFGKEIFELYNGIPADLMVYKDAVAYKALFPGEREENLLKEDKEQKTKVSYRYLIFIRFFLYLRDEFLLNDNAGLDYYLSSRVRHGTIANQLRFNFQDLKLTTRKGISGNYDMNLYWVDEIFHLEGEEHVKCMEAFLLFTQHVDEIINDLNKNKIQVKTEKHNTELLACFDFSNDKISDAILETYIDNDGLSYELILDEVFKKLWEITETCFPVVVSAVSETETRLKYELDFLYRNVKACVSANTEGWHLFETTFGRCLTHLHEDIKLVSQWFKRKQQQNENFQMQQLLDASVEAINKVRSNHLTFELQISSNSSFKGKYLIVFFDLFHNIFNNVVDYFDKKNETPTCEVVVNEEEKMLNIQVSNLIRAKDIPDAEKKISNYKDYHNGQNKQSRSRLEGKSGLYKIDTIVYHQLMGEGNVFTPLVRDNQFVVSISIYKLNMVSDVQDIID